MSFSKDRAHLVTTSKEDELVKDENALLVAEAKEAFESGSLEEITLSDRDRDFLLSTLEDPPSPEEIEKVLKAIHQKKAEQKSSR